MIEKIHNATLKQDLHNMIDVYGSDPKIRTDKSRKRMILKSWKTYVYRAMTEEIDSMQKCVFS